MKKVCDSTTTDSKSGNQEKVMELNGKKVVKVEVDGVDTRDYPDYCDAYFSYAEYEDGTKLTDEELDDLTYSHPEDVHAMAWKSAH